MTTHEGGCLCGQLRFRVSGNGRQRCVCHCRSCQLASGAPSVAWATFDREEFEILCGSLQTFRSSPGVERGFCSRCGTAITYRGAGQEEELDVAVACLDNPDLAAPELHIWTSHKPVWVRVDDGLPQFEKGGEHS